MPLHLHIDPSSCGPPLPHSTTSHSPDIILTSQPGTSIWRKPSGKLDMFNAPHRLTPPALLSTFSRARVTISAQWCARRDNAGLLLVFTDKRAVEVQRQQWSYGSHGITATATATGSAAPKQWLRICSEMYREASSEYAHIIVASCENAATDWSLHPRDPLDEGPPEEVTVEVRLERDVVGDSLWMYYLAADGSGAVKSRHPLRELSWMFVDGWERNMDVQVGVYCSFPAFGEASRGKELVARFSRLQIEWEDDG